jgi:charged multivesicular body protein 1
LFEGGSIKRISPTYFERHKTKNKDKQSHSNMMKLFRRNTLNLEDITFNLKFTSKQFERASKKSEKDEKTQRLKIKKAIEAGNLDGARVYAEAAIRKKNESLNYLRMASRIDAVVSRMDTAIKMNQVSKTMGSVVQGMDKVLATMDVDRIAQVMDRFESQFSNLDVTSKYMEDSMAQSTSMTTPEDQVNTLLLQVADEHGLDVNAKLGTIETSKDDIMAVQLDELSKRQAALKSANL